MTDQTKKEDFFVLADLTIDDRVLSGIPCQVYLPRKPSDKPVIRFKPSKAQYDSVNTFRCGFHAETHGLDGTIDTIIDAPIVYLKDMLTTHWGPSLVVAEFNGDPQHLRVVRFLSGGHQPVTRCRITWWVSPNRMLLPHLIIRSSFTGSVQVERPFRHTFRLERHLVVTFDKHFSSRSEGDTCVQWSHLVGTSRHASRVRETVDLCAELLPRIDDFLLIVSLASRTRTACIGWEAVDSRCVTSYYRGEFVFPTGDSEPSYRDGLVTVNDFRDFVTTAYSAFRAQSDPDPVRGAIHALVPGKSHSLERTFLSLFAALEMLLLDFRRRNNLEFVMREDEWKVVKASCRKFIKEQTRATVDKFRRSLIYSKLDELNRVPLRVVLGAFGRQYHVQLDDLWPLFSEAKGEIGLSDIRNMVIHGEPLGDRYMDALWVATEHLKWTVERIVVGLLNWPAERTEVTAAFLRRVARPMIELESVRRAFEADQERRRRR